MTREDGYECGATALFQETFGIFYEAMNKLFNKSYAPPFTAKCFVSFVNIKNVFKKKHLKKRVEDKVRLLNLYPSHEEFLGQANKLSAVLGALKGKMEFTETLISGVEEVSPVPQTMAGTKRNPEVLIRENLSFFEKIGNSLEARIHDRPASPAEREIPLADVARKGVDALREGAAVLEKGLEEARAKAFENSRKPAHPAVSGTTARLRAAWTSGPEFR